MRLDSMFLTEQWLGSDQAQIRLLIEASPPHNWLEVAKPATE